MSKSVRVRFAPSPTGPLHVGSIRSGLFNWLWARHNDGVFVLRIEDTDQARLVEGATEQISQSLTALGIAPDEGPDIGGNFGPYLQSERLHIYRQHADALRAKGSLYPCWCTPERLSELRANAQKAGIAFKYDRHCLKSGNEQSTDQPHVLRFKIPKSHKNSAGASTSVNWNDAVRGEMGFLLEDLDDFVAIKSDGFPTYHFANVVDDHLMEISHVLRADEWLPSTPKHLLLFEAFEWAEPTYGHLPPVQGPDGKKKLSKRDGAQSVQEYLAEGYLPEALRCFLASLGWNDGSTQEVYTTDELIKNFSLARIQKSPAQFSKDRLTWMNGVMIRQMSIEALLERAESFLPPEANAFSQDYQKAAIRLVQDRLKTLSELPELTNFFFVDPSAPSQLDAPYLTSVIDALSTNDFSETNLEITLRDLAASLDIKTGTLFSTIRIAITGKKAAPGLFETLHVLGKDTSLRRLTAASKHR